MELAEAAEASTREVDTKEEAEAHPQAITIMTETMVAGGTKAVMREEDMVAAAVVAMVVGAIDGTITGVGIMRRITVDRAGVRAAMMEHSEGVAMVVHLVETQGKTHILAMDAPTLDHEPPDHQEAMHQ